MRNGEQRSYGNGVVGAKGCSLSDMFQREWKTIVDGVRDCGGENVRIFRILRSSELR